jgi:pyruvate,water dikinase
MNDVIRGKVTIIKNKKDYYRIKRETILVAKNTHPDLVVVINKIKAIVTEIDNKLCHAAIIAREFDKPLLMGIHNVTKEFKTGDKVMIDFENKIINKMK